MATVPLVLQLSAVIEYAEDGPVVVLMADGKVIDRKPLRDYLSCPVCGQATDAESNRGDDGRCSN